MHWNVWLCMSQQRKNNTNINKNYSLIYAMNGKIISYEKKYQWRKNLSYHLYNVVDSAKQL